MFKCCTQLIGSVLFCSRGASYLTFIILHSYSLLQSLMTCLLLLFLLWLCGPVLTGWATRLHCMIFHFHTTLTCQMQRVRKLWNRGVFLFCIFFPPALSTLFVHFTNCHSKHFHFVRYIKIFAVFLYYPYKLNWWI